MTDLDLVFFEKQAKTTGATAKPENPTAGVEFLGTGQ